MGMYDREPNFEETFTEGDRFVVLNAEYVGTINTREGPAEKVILEIVSRMEPTKRIKYSALGVGLANQAKRASRSDFPHVAEFVRVPTGTGDNKVKLLAKVDVEPRAFIDGDDGPPIQVQADLLSGSGSGGNGEEPIPF